jgi:hypothetical protein
MVRKYLSVFLVLILLHITTGSAFSSTRAEKDVQRREEVQAQVAKHGTGEKARIRVKMMDGKTLKGFIEEAGADSFVLRESATWAPTTIAYSDVSKIKDKEASTCQKVLFVWALLGVASLVLFRGNTD